MINSRAIKLEMINKNVTMDDLAEAIGKRPTSVRHKIENHRPMSLDEAEIVQRMLNIQNEDFAFYFFSQSRSATEIG